MELLTSLMFVLALALVVGLFIARPFLRKGAVHTRTQEEATQREHERSSLLAERDRVLNALQDLDFDFALGKVPEEDYPFMRDELLKAGAATLRKLEAFEAPASTASAEDRIEAAVAARRADAARGSEARGAATRPGTAVAAVGTNGHGGNGARGDALEELIATRKRVRQESASGFCPKCGKPAQKSDKFCSKCGTTL